MCNDVFSTAMTAFFTLGQVFFNASASMVGIMLVYLALNSVISWFQIRSQNGMRERIIRQKNVFEGQLTESIKTHELIRSMGAEQYESKRLLPSIRSISRTEKSHHWCMGMFDGLKKFCKIAFHIIILAASVLLIANGRMATGSVITVCLLFEQLIRPIDEVYRFMDETASSVIKAKALFELLFSPDDEIFGIQSSGTGIDDHAIRIKDLVIANPQMDHDIAWFDDIVIHEGAITAITGASGSGKSSLIKCVNRYLPHIRGTISLFGRELQSYSQKELTDVLYYTPQKSFFVSGTVRENLLYGLDRKVDDRELLDALKSVYLTGNDNRFTVICPDPKKALDYQIGETNSGLSGGMEQRLSLARAFLRRPRLFVFDEITASLDNVARDAVLSNIEAFARKIGAGIVYITHNPKVIDRCSECLALWNLLQKSTEGKEAA